MTIKSFNQICLLASSIVLLASCGNNEQESSEQTAIIEESAETSDPNDAEENGYTNGSEDDENNGENLNDESTVEEQDGTLANMSEEERYAHYRSLANAPDRLDETVFENLELPGIHENTAAYGGRVNPGSTIEMEIYDRRGDLDSSSDLEVNKEGFFAVDLYQYESIEGDELTLHINHGELENEQLFILPIHPIEEGMDVIQPLSDTSEYEEQLLSTLDLDDIPTVYPNALNLRGSVGRHLEALLYSLGGDMQGDSFMAYSQRDNDEGDYLRLDTYPEAGQRLTYYVVGDGVIASFEDEVEEMTPEAEAAAEIIRNETDFPIDTDSDGELTVRTIPNAEILTRNIEMGRATNLRSDENGEAVFPTPENFNEPGTTLYVTIRDEDGYTETIEIDF